MITSIIIPLFLFIPLLVYAQVNKNCPIFPSDLSINLWVTIAGVISSMFFGGLAGAIISNRYNRKKSEDIYKALLIAYCLEFFYAFERCVIYYRQFYRKDEISYSSIFEFSDIAFLSRFTEVCRDMQLVNTIVSLKSNYFQIARHVEKVSDYIIESRGFESIDDINYRKRQRRRILLLLLLVRVDY